MVIPVILLPADMVDGGLIVTERVLLLELCIGLHHRANLIPQHVTDGYRITGADQIMDL